MTTGGWYCSLEPSAVQGAVQAVASGGSRSGKQLSTVTCSLKARGEKQDCSILHVSSGKKVFLAHQRQGSRLKLAQLCGGWTVLFDTRLQFSFVSILLNTSHRHIGNPKNWPCHPSFRPLEVKESTWSQAQDLQFVTPMESPSDLFRDGMTSSRYISQVRSL